MEENQAIQDEIQALEEHLEGVRKRVGLSSSREDASLDPAESLEDIAKSQFFKRFEKDSSNLIEKGYKASGRYDRDVSELAHSKETMEEHIERREEPLIEEENSTPRSSLNHSSRSRQYESLDSREIEGISQHLSNSPEEHRFSAEDYLRPSLSNPFIPPQAQMVHGMQQPEIPAVQMQNPLMPMMQGMMPPGAPSYPYPYYPMYYPPPPMPNNDLAYRQQIESLQAQINGQSQYIQNLLARHQDEIETLKRNYQENLAGKDKKISQLSKTIESDKLYISELEEQSRNSGDKNINDYSDFKEKIEALENLNEKLKNQLEIEREKKVQEKSGNFENDYVGLKQKNVELNKELSLEQAKYDNLLDRFNANKSKLAILQKELEKSDEKILHLQNELLEAKNLIAGASKQKNQETERLKREVVYLTKTLENLNKRPEPGEISKLRQQLLESQREIEELKELLMPKESRHYQHPHDDYEEYQDEYKIPDKRYEESSPYYEENYSPSQHRISNAQPREQPSQPRISERPSGRRRGSKSNISTHVGNVLNWENQLDEPSLKESPVTKSILDPILEIENTLMNLQLDKQRLESEYSKLPAHSKSRASKLRRDQIEEELSVVDRNISNLKSKLRGMHALR
ncbi:unnamed protein product [Blepharisma stoltei]|uniref:Centriolin n=1 Tax=Blepharisma stoltei TaxID=1481888 RepID=A0AAU9JK59_9CILI|nr:unnamed protein product [Blepharisma stoltei]